MNGSARNAHAFILVSPAPGAPWHHPVTPSIIRVRIKGMSAILQRRFSSPPDTEQVQQPKPLSKVNLSEAEFRNYRRNYHHWISRECPGCPIQQMPNSCTGFFFAPEEEKQPSKGKERLLREKLLSNFKGKIFRERWINELVSKQVPCFYRW